MSRRVPANPATCATCPSDRNRSAIPRWSSTSIVRECRPPARDPASSWPARRSTIATSTPAKTNSPANISPVGPPPAITTACPVNALRENSQSGARFETRETAAAAAELDEAQPCSRRIPRQALHHLDRVVERLELGEDPAVGVVDEEEAHEVGQ